MTSASRGLIALAILLAGLALLPQVNLFAGPFGWQRYRGMYEDNVTVTRARYRDGELDVRAMSSSGSAATLWVYKSATNESIGALTYDATSGEHEGSFTLADPGVISVRSSLGGSSTVLTNGESVPPVTVTPAPSAPTIQYLPLIHR